MNSEFKKGDKVVYPSHGLGIVKDITEQVFGDSSIKFLVISFDKVRMKLRIPLNNIENSGLRHISSKDDVDNAVVLMQKAPKNKRVIWSKRVAEYEEKISSSDVLDTADVIRSLNHKKYSDTQSYSERNLYDTALERLAEEYSAVYDMPEDEAMDKLDNLLKKSEEKRTGKNSLSSKDLDDLEMDEEFEDLAKDLKKLKL